MKKFVLLWFVILPINLTASQVLRVGASQQVCAVSALMQGAWAVGDRGCISFRESLSVCGNIVSITPEYSVLKLDKVSTWVSPGQTVRKVGAGAKPVETPPLMGARDERRKKERMAGGEEEMRVNNFSAGAAFGLNFLFPILHYQRLLNESLSMGLMPLYFRSDSVAGTLNGFGGVVTTSWYVDEFFRGIWLQFGAGIIYLSNAGPTLTESSASVIVLATGGWRHEWQTGWNIGIAGGMQYFKDPEFQAVKVSAANLQPLAIFEVGYSF